MSAAGGRDPLWPAGDRPMCGECKAVPVYMAGLCGSCWAAKGRAAAAVTCSGCGHAHHWRECQADVLGLLGTAYRCPCRRRGPRGSEGPEVGGTSIRSTLGAADVVLGEVEERTWTVVQHEVDGFPVPGSTGRREVSREVRFAFRLEAEAWAEAQRAEGFTEFHFSHTACGYYGPTDSLGNCWTATARRRIARSGDRVEVVWPGSAFEGRTGVVEQAFDETANVVLDSPGVREPHMNFGLQELRVLDEAWEDNMERFARGDS